MAGVRAQLPDRFREPDITNTVTVRHGTHLRETSDLPCDRVHGTSTAIEVMVDGDGGAVEKKRADGGGIRLARRAVGFLPPMVVERAWTW